jgi:hypothetical protein
MNLTVSHNGREWICVDADTYDGAPDASNHGEIGYGPTPDAARADWIEQYGGEL